jgi:hypothetical protein
MVVDDGFDDAWVRDNRALTMLAEGTPLHPAVLLPVSPLRRACFARPRNRPGAKKLVRLSPSSDVHGTRWPRRRALTSNFDEDYDNDEQRHSHRRLHHLLLQVWR